MHWETLYRLATEEPVSEVLVKFRIWLSLIILPKPLRDLAKPLLETTTKLIKEEMDAGNKNISIDVTVTGRKDDE